tara:strand:- start:450 stop:605 length:156 start_codon:yes stop_codon:yes gene_type:complete
MIGSYTTIENTPNSYFTLLKDKDKQIEDEGMDEMGTQNDESVALVRSLLRV